MLKEEESFIGSTTENSMAQHEFSIELKHDVSQLQPYLTKLEKLANNVVEPNVFYEPWMLLPALENYASCNTMVFLLVIATDKSDGSSFLCGFFPMEIRTSYRGLPCRNIALWHYPHCYLATPILHDKFAKESLGALTDWFQRNRRYSLMVLNQISATGKFHNALNEVLASESVKYFGKKYERAFFNPDKDFATYLERALSSRRRKEYRRLLRRLSECGDLQWKELSPTDDINIWIKGFLHLEATGWKGESGTALRSSESGRKFFNQILVDAFGRKRLIMLGLYLDDKPVAMISILLTDQGGYAFKIAYDENFGTFSPGVLLVIELIRRLHKREGFTWLDSCAAPSSTIANRMWIDRKPMRNVTIANPHSTGAFLVRLLPAMSRIKAQLVS